MKMPIVGKKTFPMLTPWRNDFGFRSTLFTKPNIRSSCYWLRNKMNGQSNILADRKKRRENCLQFL